MRASEFGEIQTVVNVTDPSGAFWETLLQKLFRIITDSDDHSRRIDELNKPDLEVPRCENVVGVRGEAESDRKKFVDPESRARCHAHEVRVNVADPHFPKAQSDINSLIEPKKIGAPTPLIQSIDDF